MRFVCLALGFVLGAQNPAAGQTIEQRFERWFGPPVSAGGDAQRPARPSRTATAAPPPAASVPVPTDRPAPDEVPRTEDRLADEGAEENESPSGEVGASAPGAEAPPVPEEWPATEPEAGEADEARESGEPVARPDRAVVDDPSETEETGPAYVSPEVARTTPEDGAPQTPESDVTPAMSVEAAVAIEDARLCEAELEARGAQFTVEQSFANGECGVLRPVVLTRTSSGVAVAPATQMLCRTALAFDIWTAESVGPAARVELGQEPPTTIRHASTYVCRERASEAGISEHARGSAIDIGAFEWADGREAIPVEAQTPGSPEDQFLASVRRGACGPFTTVIGPGTDADHDDHFHLDLAARDNGATYCR